MQSDIQCVIEKLKHAQVLSQQLHSLKQELKLDCDLLQDYIYILRNDLYCFYASPPAAQFLGYEQQDLIGKNMADIKLDSSIRFLLETAQQVNKHTSGNSILPTGAGLRCAKYTIMPIDNHVIILMLKEISKIAANNIKDIPVSAQCKTAKYITKLGNMCPLPIYVINNQEQITVYNAAFADLFHHYQDINLTGMKLNKLTDLIGYKYENTLTVKALQGIETKGYYTQIMGKPYLINACPIYSDDLKTIEGALAIFQDMSNHEQYQKEISRLDRLNLIAEMAAGVAHEIRNPMTVIRGYLQILMNKSSAHLHGKFRIILDELDQVNSIISNFLSLARNKPDKLENQDLNRIIHNIYPLIYSDTVTKGINLIINLQDELPLLPLNDKEIHQLLLNLSRNGIEAMSGKGELKLKTSMVANTIELSISDTGCGIPPEYIEKIFDPFFTTKENGTGLGLSICNSIVKRHGGAFKVISQQGSGTTFVITFPIH